MKVSFFYSGTKVGDVALFEIVPEDVREEYRASHPTSYMSLVSMLQGVFFLH